MRVRISSSLVAVLAMLATAGLAGCGEAEPEPVEQAEGGSRWPAAEQNSPTSQVLPDLPTEDSHGDVVVYEDLCDSLARPMLDDYLSGAGDDDEWKSRVRQWPGGSGLDLTERPTADKVQHIAEMPGEGASEVWCEAVSDNAMWLVGVSWANGDPAIRSIQTGAR